MEQDRTASIQARAYQLWEESGQEHGSHERHWQQAERDIGAAEPTGEPSASPIGDGPSTATVGDADASPVQDGHSRKLKRIPSPIVQP